MGAGYTHGTTVKTTNVNNIKDSLLFTSSILTRKNLENDPANAILLNM